MRITVKDAARLMGVSPQFVRIGMQRGLLPIGTAVKLSSVWTYYISEAKLKEYTGAATPANRKKGRNNAENVNNGKP